MQKEEEGDARSDAPLDPSVTRSASSSSNVNATTDSTAPLTLSRKSMILRTVVLYIGFVLLGMVMSILGPTLLDLQYISESSTEEIAIMITGRSVGILLGCLLSMLLMKYLDPWLTLGMCQLVLGGSAIVLPWLRSIYPLVAVSLVLGVGSGQYDAGGNVCLLFIWQSENGPWMQALHLFYGVGAILGPLIAKPFLVETSDDQQNPQSTNNHTLNTTAVTTMLGVTETTFNVGGNVTIEVDTAANLLYPPLEESMIMIPYGIIGVGEILIGIVMLCIFIRDGCNIRARKKTETKDETPRDGKSMRSLKKMRIAIICVIFIFYLLYCTVESEMGNFLLLFCVSFLGWTKSDGALITAAFWTAFTISRGVGIFLVKCLKPQTMIFWDIIISILGCLPLLFFVTYHPAVMWVCSIVTGAGFATIFATGITWTDQYIKVTEAVGSVFMLGGALSDTYGPILIVYLMERVHFMSYIYFMFGAIVGMAVIMIILQVMANMYVKRKEKVLAERENGEEGDGINDSMVMEINA